MELGRERGRERERQRERRKEEVFWGPLDYEGNMASWMTPGRFWSVNLSIRVDKRGGLKTVGWLVGSNYPTIGKRHVVESVRWWILFLQSIFLFRRLLRLEAS